MYLVSVHQKVTKVIYCLKYVLVNTKQEVCYQGQPNLETVIF